MQSNGAKRRNTILNHANSTSKLLQNDKNSDKFAKSGMIHSSSRSKFGHSNLQDKVIPTLKLAQTGSQSKFLRHEGSKIRNLLYLTENNEYNGVQNVVIKVKNG